MDTMRSWAVYVQAETSRPLDEDTSSVLATLLAGYDAAVGPAPDGYGVNLSLPAASWHRAGQQAEQAVTAAAKEAGIETTDVVALEVLTESELDRRLDVPPLPELVGAAEVADMLRVSKQRLQQLVAQRRDFPHPIIRLRSGPVWLAPTIRAFDRRWTRTPGRPPAIGKSASVTSLAGAGSARKSTSLAPIKRGAVRGRGTLVAFETLAAKVPRGNRGK